MTQEEINSLLTETSCLFQHIFYFKQVFDILPSKEHIGTSIAYTDVLPRTDDFLKELNIPTKINRHSGMAKTARPEYRIPL